MDIALEKPEDTIFIVPLRLDACELPRRLRSLQWVDYFPSDRRDWAYKRLLQSLKFRGGQTKIRPLTQEMQNALKSQELGDRNLQTPKPVSEPTTLTKMRLAVSNRQETFVSIALIAYFLFLSFYYIGGSNEVQVFSVFSGVIAAVALWRGRIIPFSKYFVPSFSLFVGMHAVLLFGYSTGLGPEWLGLVFGLIAAVQGFVSLFSMGKNKSLTAMSTTFLVLYISLTSILIGMNALDIYPDWPPAPIVIFGILSAALLWRENS